MIAFRKLYSPTVIKVVWWLTVILAALFLIVSEYFGIRLWSIALGLGEQPTATATETPLPGEFGQEGEPMDFPPTTGLEGLLSQIGTVVGQFLVAVAVGMIVVPPVIAVLWVVWTRLILEALVVNFKVEDNTRRTPLVDQTQPTS